MYHRVGAAAYKADIQPTLDLMDHLGHPERKFPSIHIAGTNGKGSVSHLLASILQQGGLRVGLYTSPHLIDFRERIRINGKMIPQDEVCTFVEQHKETFERLHLSFFEMTVGLAFQYFAEQQVDIAVVEVGMGGRLDSTNVITPLLSVITNIGLEHTQFLGTTLSAIAREKAGIIKEGVPVVIGETHPETEPVFRQIAAERHAPILFADQEFFLSIIKETTDHLTFCIAPRARTNNDLPIENPQSGANHLLHSRLHHAALSSPSLPEKTQYTCPLAGSYQKKNLITLFGALQTLASTNTSQSARTNNDMPLQHRRPNSCHLSYSLPAHSHRTPISLPFDLQPLTIHAGIAHVIDNTHFQGRWQTIGHNPLVICETAHNADGVEAMMQKLSTLHFRQLHLVYGCVNDKNFREILRLFHSHFSILNFHFSIYYTQPSVPRALPVDQLAQAAEEIQMTGKTYPDVHQAIAAARSTAHPNDLILVTGSIFLVADALASEG